MFPLSISTIAFASLNWLLSLHLINRPTEPLGMEVLIDAPLPHNTY